MIGKYQELHLNLRFVFLMYLNESELVLYF